MTDPTFCPISASTTEVSAALETATSPAFTEAGVETFAWLGGSFARGHTPIDGGSHFGSVQTADPDGSIPGLLDPQVQMLLPFRYENMQRVLEMVLGGANLTSGPAVWPITNSLNYWSVGVNDGAVYRQFAGCQVNSAQIRAAQGEASTIGLNLLSLLLNDEADHTTFPPADPDVTTRPFVLTDSVLKILATLPTGPDPEIPVDGVTIDIANNLIIARANSRRPRCFRRGTLSITGTLDFQWSEDLSTTVGILEAASEANFELAFLELIWTEPLSSRFIKFVLPVKLDFQNWTVPRGSGVIASPLSFRAHADGVALTNPMIAATSTVY